MKCIVVPFGMVESDAPGDTDVYRSTVNTSGSAHMVTAFMGSHLLACRHGRTEAIKVRPLASTGFRTPTHRHKTTVDAPVGR
jgi:hypothetical protein